MALRAGIVGLPNVGKSTLFGALTRLQVLVANYPFATIEPNVGIVPLPDERLEKLSQMVRPQKLVPALVEFIDIAGLVKGASSGEGLGNKFLANIREVDAIIHVVRCFAGAGITHVSGQVDPLSDSEVVNLELALADYDVVKNILERLKRKVNATHESQAKQELAVAEKLAQALAAGRPARLVLLTAEEQNIMKQWQLLTAKPMLYVANVSEGELGVESASLVAMRQRAASEKARVVAVAAATELSLSELKGAEREEMIQALGLINNGLAELIRAAFDLLGLATFFTAGAPEVRAWVFKKGQNAAQCAGIIHSDFERGFIRAQVISYDDYVRYHGESGARQAGRLRDEGRDYLMQDGDVVHFKFNV